MIIKKFKFKDAMLVEAQIPNIINNANIFGLHYITDFILYIVTNFFTKNIDLAIKKETIYRLELLRSTKSAIYWKNTIYSRELEKILAPLLSFNSNYYITIYLEDLLTSIEFSNLLFIPKINIVNIKPLDDDNFFEFVTLYTFDINKIEKMLLKKFYWLYIYDKSKWKQNWYSFEKYTRAKNAQKYVIPFYRNLKRLNINLNILETLGVPFDKDKLKIDEEGGSPYYILAEALRKKLQKKDLFNIKQNYQIINSKYYLYNDKFIDIDFNLYQLNKKWLIEANIIKKSVKNR